MKGIYSGSRWRRKRGDGRKRRLCEDIQAVRRRKTSRQYGERNIQAVRRRKTSEGRKGNYAKVSTGKDGSGPAL